MIKKEKPIIGWREWVELPDFKRAIVKAKVDSGARTSSLHAYNIQMITRKGKRKARFELYPNQNNKNGKRIVEAPLVEHRSVKSSSGHQEQRPVILTNVKMADEVWLVEITLTNRDIMGFRMLLGRQAIRNRFLIDTGKSFLTHTTKARKGHRK